jgi:hypothetical protein
VPFLAVTTPSQPFVALFVAAVLLVASRPIIHKVARHDPNPSWLLKILTAALLLHLIASPVQIWVVDHFYHGIADWVRYDSEGARLGAAYRHFNFSLGTAHLHGIVGDSSVSIIAGVVFAIVGTNQAAAFLIFSWFAYMGLVLFYLAFRVTFEGANPRRYAILVFFFPSLIFWSADVSKEAIMTLALGMIAYGAAKYLTQKRGSVLLLLGGSAIASIVRPNELFLVLAGLAGAVVIQPSRRSKQLAGLRRVGVLVAVVALLIGAIYLTVHYLPGKGHQLSLTQIAKNNSGEGSSVGYSPGPTGFLNDIYNVLLNPLPINAHGSGERLQALENTVLVILILASLRQLRIVLRTAFCRTYVFMCIVYSITFVYSFAALGNLGLITRERTLLFPFLLVLFAIPRAPRGEKPIYDWEFRRKERLARKRSPQGGTVGSSSSRPTGRRYPMPLRPPRGRIPVAARQGGLSADRFNNLER